MIAAGDLIHRVTIEDTVSSTNEYGEVARQWVGIADVWCVVEALSGREQLMAQQMQSIVSHRVRMRVNSYVKSSMRLRWNDRILNIESVISVGKDETQLLCREVQQ